jgi:hypothetical protein
MHFFDLSPDIEVAYLGLPLSSGPLPALFYFALSAQDSLCQDPFNQIVSYLSSFPMRIFSMTLPGHENQMPPTQALHFWAKEIAQGNNIIAAFVDKIKLVIDTFLHQRALVQDRIAVAGLSRGAFIATHAAAAIAHFRWILGFAPLTDLSFAREFQDLHNSAIVHSLALKELMTSLISRPVRYYIGNLDTRVSTRHCFDFVEKLAQTAYHHQIRCPQVELIIGPSIGRDGHGTSKQVFHQGAQWIAEKLGVADAL